MMQDPSFVHNSHHIHPAESPNHPPAITIAQQLYKTDMTPKDQTTSFCGDSNEEQSPTQQQRLPAVKINTLSMDTSL